MPMPIRYHFTQRFLVSAKKAFEWCTNFDPRDPVLMGEEGVERRVTLVAEGVIVLKDSFHSEKGVIEKEKLVELYPDRLSWVSTHLSGPNKYSQFLYVITPDGEAASTLGFTGLHLEYEAKEDAQSLAERLRLEDAGAWKLLAKAMTRELKKSVH
jgi:hypothetical protein